MYKLEPATVEDYKELAFISTETGKPDYEMLKDANLTRCIIKGELVALAGYKDMMLPDKNNKYSEYRVLSGLFRKDIAKYTLTLVKAGRKYLSEIKDKPLLALAVADNRVFNRFLEYMKFSDTKELVSDKESGIMYRMYVRK